MRNEELHCHVVAKYSNSLDDCEDFNKMVEEEGNYAAARTNVIIK